MAGNHRSKNKTLKLEHDLQERVRKAMVVKGSTVFNDFGRMALVAYCRAIEQELLRTNPEEYRKIYGGPAGP